MTSQNTAPPPPAKLPSGADRWAVDVDGKQLSYGDIHEIIHRDISIGNTYRMERIKLLTALATGVIALTVTFHKDFLGGQATGCGLALVGLGWLCLIGSLLAGVIHFQKWEDFYLEHRAKGQAVWNYHVAQDDAGRKNAVSAFERAGKEIEEFRESYRIWNFLQVAGLVGGLALIALYVFFGVQGKAL